MTRVRLWPVALLQVELTSAERLGRGKNLQGPRFGGSKQITVRSWGTMAKGRPASPSDFFSSDAFVGSRGLKTGISILCRLQQTTLVIRPRGTCDLQIVRFVPHSMTTWQLQREGRRLEHTIH